MNIITKHDFKSSFDALLKNIANPNFLITNKAKIPFQKKLLRPSAVCVSKSKFLLFNSKAIKFLIIDKDNITLDDFLSKYADKLMLLRVNWLIETDNGIQLCYQLENAIPKLNASLSSLQYLKAIKTKLVKLFEADEIASMRDSAIYRNPFNHKGYIDLDHSYTLKDIAKAIDLEPKYKVNKGGSNTAIPFNSKILDFGQGNRNNALYWHFVFYINGNPNTTLKAFEDWGELVNREQGNPLPVMEARKTARSAWRQYHEKGRRLKFNVVFDHKKWKKEYNKKHYSEQINKPLEQIMTKSESIKYARAILETKTKTKVEQALNSMEFLNEKITINKVSKVAGVNYRSAKKYMEELGYLKA